MTRMLFQPALAALLTLATVATDAEAARDDFPLREAKECRPRGGMPNVFAKLEAGKPVRIAYLGGSITAQAGWRVLSREWLAKEYPKCDISETHAAIGGTGSDLGVFRVEHDALADKPDLLFVEFAVNDNSAPAEQIIKAMEGIVRKTWQADPTTDICYVYTVAQRDLEFLQAGNLKRSASVMESVADHYGIPSICMGLEVARMTERGEVIFKGDEPKTDAEKKAMAGKVLFSKDGVHPLVESGHPLYLAAIQRSIPAIKAEGKPGPHAVPAPMREDNWENAKMVPLSAAKMSAGWEKLEKGDPLNLVGKFGNRLPGVWAATQPGESIEFKFRGTDCMMYDLVGPDCGVVGITVDDHPMAKRPRFDRYCTYHRLQRLSVLRGAKDEVHTVRIETLPDDLDKVEILKGRNNKMDNPKRFAGKNWYAGAMLILGDMAE